MKFVNLTPHQITVIAGAITHVINPDGRVARVKTSVIEEQSLNGLPVRSIETGQVEGLPAPENDTVYIVSGMVLAAIPLTIRPHIAGRRDVVAPGELVRDDAGRPIGCKGFTSKPGGVRVPEDLCKSCGQERHVSGDAGYCGPCLGE